MNQRSLFLKHVAQTSPAPLALEIIKAKGTKLFDTNGKEYLDLIAGISVCNVGHTHPKVVNAIKKQVDQYMHLLVYGEIVETPQVQYAKLLSDLLPNSLNSVFFTNSGAEATEGALKLAKRYTGRTQIVAFNKSYHGSTHGALSVMGDEYWRNAYRPLLPDVLHLEYNSQAAIQSISKKTACVIMETVQAERGVYAPDKKWIKALAKRCKETGTLLIMDEIQTGFGRTGEIFGFKKFKVTPDIVLLGKALGGGMPLGAFVSDKKIMSSLTENPVLGHITTFGGHPVSCAAGMAATKVLVKENLLDKVKEKELMFHEMLIHPKIKVIRSVGLLLAVEFHDEAICHKAIAKLIENGYLTDWFLFAPQCLRIAPPLIITKKEIKSFCKELLSILDDLQLDTFNKNKD
jgi:acetylornithine/N-succinyldiaminopimelate aminotransferase